MAELYHNIGEIESALRNLASAHPRFCELIELPERTFEGRKILCLRIGARAARSGDGALLVSGHHAREWVPPEAAIGLAADLAAAYADGQDLVYGNARYSAAQVRQIVNAVSLFIVPCANPDGRHFTQSSDNSDIRLWRRNRTTAHNSAPNCRGVDLNRNYDFAFDLDRYFDPTSTVTSFTSANPCHDAQIYQGPSPFSEPETRNVRWLLDTYPRIRWFVDIHGFKGEVYHPFGDDQNQNRDPTMTWRNQDFDRKRGKSADAYSEYIAPDDLQKHQALAGSLREGILRARNADYPVKQSYDLYPTAGLSQDYAWTRHQVAPLLPRVEAFSIEHEAEAQTILLGFQPLLEEKDIIVRELISGLINFSLKLLPRTLQLVVADMGYVAGGWRVEKHPRLLADVTGDRRADIVGFGDDGVWVALSNGDGSFRAPRFVLADFGQEAGGWRVDKHPRFMADVTGDGRADIVGFGNDGVFVALSNGDGSFQAPRFVIADLAQAAGGWRVDRHPRLLADLTGDGRADIVGFGDGGVFVALSKGDGGFQAPRFVLADFGQEAGGWRVDKHPRFLADVTGDGRADIVGFGDDGVLVALGNGDGTFQAPRLGLANFGFNAGGWRVDKHPRFLADVTGDGRADIVGFGNAGVFVALSNGDGTFQPARLVIENFGFVAGSWRTDRHPRLLADLTGDGRADIVGFGDRATYAALARGDGGFDGPRHILGDLGYEAGGWRVARHPRLVADVTGDGRADIVGFGDHGIWVAVSNVTFL